MASITIYTTNSFLVDGAMAVTLRTYVDAGKTPGVAEILGTTTAKPGKSIAH